MRGKFHWLMKITMINFHMFIRKTLSTLTKLIPNQVVMNFDKTSTSTCSKCNRYRYFHMLKSVVVSLLIECA